MIGKIFFDSSVESSVEVEEQRNQDGGHETSGERRSRRRVSVPVLVVAFVRVTALALGEETREEISSEWCWKVGALMCAATVACEVC